jgi:hypothetical protein
LSVWPAAGLFGAEARLWPRHKAAGEGGMGKGPQPIRALGSTRRGGFVTASKTGFVTASRGL